MDGRGATDGKALLSHPKERNTSTAKLTTLEGQDEHTKPNGGLGMLGGNLGQRTRSMQVRGGYVVLVVQA